MDRAHDATLFLHLLGTAALVGGWLATFRRPTVLGVQHVGAWIQLASGILLVGLVEMNDDVGPVNHTKIGIKLLILIGALVAAFVGRRKVTTSEAVPTGVAHAVGGLALINVALAVFW